jgi:hypothetical protein
MNPELFRTIAYVFALAVIGIVLLFSLFMFIKAVLDDCKLERFRQEKMERDIRGY